MLPKPTRAAAWLTVLVLAAACASSPPPSAQASPTPSPVATPSFSTPAAPQPEQRMEAALPAPIEEAAAASAGGKLYVMGGFNAAGASLDTVYVFDGSTWSAGPPLPLPVDHPSAATLDGRLYLSGGHSNGSDTGRLLRLDGGYWTDMAPMHFPRGGHALVAAEGRLFAIGGNTANGQVAAVESYDPVANVWSTPTTMPSPRNHVSGFVVGGNVCVAGGRYPTTARVDCLDVAHATWSRLPDLPRATSGAGAVTFLGGAVVMAGGQNAGETAIVDQFTSYMAGKAWSTGQTMLVPRHGFELAVFRDRAWACGGGTAPGLHPVAACTSLGNLSAVQRGK
jgi:N-acetylneuraminic acid mutarotase